MVNSMFQPDRDEPERPKLQLELAGDGPGTNRPTRVGAGHKGGEPDFDRTGLPPEPWWWRFVGSSTRANYRQFFQKQAQDTALRILESAGVPPLYRLGLGLLWDFIIPDRDEFSVEDIAHLLVPPFRNEVPTPQQTRRFLQVIESRSTYQLWKTYGSDISGQSRV